MEKRGAWNSDDSLGIYTAACPACGFTRSGHVFTGWNTKKNGTGDVYLPLDFIDIQENITLYAQWAQAWTVRLHPNYDGGDDYVPQEIERGKGAALNAPFTREGYVLSGWNTAADGSGTSYAPGETITPTRDISLYAQWHEHDYRFDSFVWAEDDKTAQAKLVCAGDGTHVVYEAAEMTACAQEASCEADARTFYEAFYGDNCDTRAVTEEGSALGHDYGQPEWKWTSEEVEADAGDGETMIRAEMEVICSRCGETFTMEADVEGETTAQPTETEPGQITYTAIAFIDDTEYTAEKTEAIPALGLPADEATEALIDAIGEVTYTPDCRAAIDMARALYDSLTAEEQALVDNYDVLTAAEEAYAALALQGPMVIAQPVDSAVAYGEIATATFSVEGEGLTYQWYGLNPGQTAFWASSLTGDTYSVGMVPQKSGRQVYCVVTDAYGNTVTSDTVTLTMQAPDGYALTVIEQPGNRTVNSGEFAYTTFTVSGDGMTYQWYGRDEGQTAFWKSGLKGDTYGLKMVREKVGRQVYCVVTDVYGNTVTSDTATLAVNVPEGYALTVGEQPVDCEAGNGGIVSTTFTVAGEDLTYQWYGRDVGQTAFWKSGLKGDTYALKMVPKKSGRQVYCVATDAYGNTVTSDIVTLTLK